MDYTYSILGLKKKTIGAYSDVICGIIWRKIGTAEDGYQGKCDTYDDLGIDETNINLFVGSDFVGYSELTEETIINWIKTGRLQEDVDLKIREDIESQFRQGSEVANGSLPWQ